MVEALAAGNPVIAHDNVYNRWIARNAALYCSCEEEFAAAVDEIINNPEKRLSMKLASIPRFQEEFTWDFVAGQYEKLLLQYHPK